MKLCTTDTKERVGTEGGKSENCKVTKHSQRHVTFTQNADNVTKMVGKMR